MTNFFDSTKPSIQRKIRGVWDTYSLIRELNSINGTTIGSSLLDQIMYRFEFLPSFGKEYWWFLFFGDDGKQMVVLVYRKTGKRMLFNRKNVEFRRKNISTFQAVTTGWIYDGRQMHDLGVCNNYIKTDTKKKKLVSQLSNRKLTFNGGFPEYDLKIDGLVHLSMKESDILENKCAHGVFVPPFGTGWIDIYSEAKGEILGEKFVGTAHLQKVVGIMPYGSFHWARVVFQDNSSFSFFCLRSGPKSSKFFHTSMDFYHHESRKRIRLKYPIIKISKKNELSSRKIEGGDELDQYNCSWTIEGRDGENNVRITLEAYAEKRFTMDGGGSQVYIEYAVKPTGFRFRNSEISVSLKDLGTGVGTFEDAYGSSIFQVTSRNNRQTGSVWSQKGTFSNDSL